MRGSIFEVEDSDPTKEQKMKQIHLNLQANGYPTLFKKAGGNIQYYSGERTAEHLEKWALNSNENNGGNNNIKEKKDSLEDKELQATGIFNALFGGYIHKESKKYNSKSKSSSKSKTRSKVNIAKINK
jgi:hypothetical protein